ncbi:MAG TPA: twin-arginine translocase TatA/TatE family subunit [Acidimicrobiales bacterium]|nr:twin-arginine translocase TatA/TatE family subunit [Acidimicrobiales bacterium]
MLPLGAQNESSEPMNLGAPELLIILVVVLLLFGSARLPKLARSIGQAQKEFKEGVKEGAKDDSETENKA